MFGYTFPGSNYGSSATPFYGNTCCPTDCGTPFGNFDSSYGNTGFNGYNGWNTPFSSWNNQYNGWDTPFSGWNNQFNGWNTPFTGWNNQFNGGNNQFNGWNTPFSGWNNQFNGWNNQFNGWNTPFSGWNNQFNGWNNQFNGWNTPFSGWNNQFNGWNMPTYGQGPNQFFGPMPNTANPWQSYFGYNGYNACKDDETCGTTNNNFYAGAYGFGEKTAESDVA